MTGIPEFLYVTLGKVIRFATLLLVVTRKKHLNILL